MATHSSWREAVADLRKLTRDATHQQRKLAKPAGLRLPKELPQLVAAARLKVTLASELCLRRVLPSTDTQLEFLASLDRRRAEDPRVEADHHEAGAWIEFLLLKRREKGLERLRLEAGDIVQVNDFAGVRLAAVVSIADDGRVHFKGGQVRVRGLTNSLLNAEKERIQKERSY